MKSDIDRLMQEKDYAAILVTGPAQHNPAMFYFAGGGHLTNADNIGKTSADLVALWNEDHPDDPVV